MRLRYILLDALNIQFKRILANIFISFYQKIIR